MCQFLCGNHSIHDSGSAKAGTSRRELLAVGASALGAAAVAAAPTTAQAAQASTELGDMPLDTGANLRRYLIKGGAVLSMDPGVGDFAQADVLGIGKHRGHYWNRGQNQRNRHAVSCAFSLSPESRLSIDDTVRRWFGSLEKRPSLPALVNCRL